MYETFDAIVIGAGQAGLAVSYWLAQHGVHHVVLERGRVGETWRSQRWASFRLNTPNWANRLPGLPFPGDPDGFERVETLADYFEAHAQAFALPIRTAVCVTGVERAADGALEARTAAGDVLRAPHIVVAAGTQNVAATPSVHNVIPNSLAQLHALDYREPGQLPPGGVLVVGGGQTGCQVAEDLLEAGRRVFMATSRVGRVPRRYRGQDIVRWFVDSGFWDVRLEDLPDPKMEFARQPQVSGVLGGHTVSYQELKRRGVTLLGHLRGAENSTLLFDSDLSANVLYADDFSRQMKERVDEYIARAGIGAPSAEVDSAETPDPRLLAEAGPATLDVTAEGITSLVWCTGVRGDLSWLRLPVLDASGRPLHTHGVSAEAGIYFVGFPWLARRSSGIIFGAGTDAAYVAEMIHARLS